MSSISVNQTPTSREHKGIHAAPGAGWITRHSPVPLRVQAVLSLPLLGLILEWLLPLRELGGDGAKGMLAAMLLLALWLMMQGLVPLKGWVWLPLNGLAAALAGGVLFGDGDVGAWLEEYIFSTIPRDASLYSGMWRFSDLSEDTKGLILLAGWGIMISAAHMLAIYRGTVWLFGGITLVYLAVLENGLDAPVYGGIVRASCWILAAQGMFRLFDLKSGAADRLRKLEAEREGYGGDRRIWMRWCAAVLALTGILAGFTLGAGALAAPSSGSGLSIPAIAEKLKELAAGGAGGTKVPAQTGRTGYDALSEDLGGPLVPGKELYFTAQTPVPVYWRGEALDTYTGRRWIRSVSREVPLEERVATGDGTLKAYKGAAASQESPADSRSSERMTQTVTLAQAAFEGMPLFSGGIIAEVKGIYGYSGAAIHPELRYDPEADTVRLQDKAYRVSFYTIEVEREVEREVEQEIEQEVEQKAGGELKPGGLDASGVEPASVMRTYLQLPEGMPERVNELGHSLTRDLVGRYEKVRAVETYLEQNYNYTLNTKVPPPDQDFVDHFLFNAKEGYCTHFATSMVVLLRSQGIPARYVTGFAPGERMEGTPDTYRITQEEAHAWVEVYFPREGWKAFDPTPGFSAGQVQASAKGEAEQSGLLERLGVKLEALWSSIRQLPFDRGAYAAVVVLIVLLASLGAMAAWMRRTGPDRVHRTLFTGKMNEKERLLRASSGVWRRLEKSHGPIQPGTTAKSYIHALPLSDKALKSELELFLHRWERAAYDDRSLTRTEKMHFLRQCRLLAKKQV